MLSDISWIELRTLDTLRKSEIISLWNREYPSKLALADPDSFDTYLESLEDKHHVLLMDDSGKLIGWLVCFIRDNARWFAMLIDSPAQGKGLGSALLDWAKRQYMELNGWVIESGTERKQNGENYKSPVNFYQKNGFEICPEVELTKKNITGILVRWRR